MQVEWDLKLECAVQVESCDVQLESCDVLVEFDMHVDCDVQECDVQVESCDAQVGRRDMHVESCGV